MDVYNAIIKRRTIRRFQQKQIPLDILQKLVNAGRIAPSAANLQPLEYLIVNDEKLLPELFFTLKWAGYIASKGEPPAGKRPVAYIVVLVNKKITASNYERDVGAAVENILLTALENGIGTCWIGTVDKKKLRKILNIPKYIIIDSVIALGYPDENPIMEEMADSVKYWKDENNVLHVPKRRLNDVMHINRYGEK
jgi:nitroreductase